MADCLVFKMSVLTLQTSVIKWLDYTRRKNKLQHN